MPASSVTTLKRRGDFLAAAQSGFKYVKPSVVVQARPRASQEFSLSGVRIGFTATKKLGNAVVRNRAKRRLRAAVAQMRARLATQCDYVFIARDAAVMGSFPDLIRDMKHALKRLADLMAAKQLPPAP